MDNSFDDNDVEEEYTSEENLDYDVDNLAKDDPGKKFTATGITIEDLEDEHKMELDNLIDMQLLDDFTDDKLQALT